LLRDNKQINIGTHTYKPSAKLLIGMQQLWLVERSVDTRDLVTLIYATTDGKLERRKEFAAATLQQHGRTVTAAIEAPVEKLEPVLETDRKRFATEATKMSKTHDPEDEI